MAKPSLGLALSWAFDTFRRFFVPFLALAAVVVVIQFFDQFTARLLDDADVNPVVTLLVSIMFLVVGLIAAIGVQRAALRATQGHEPSFADMLTTQHLGKYLLLALVYSILTIFGFLLCIIPGLLVIFFFELAPYYILDRGVGVFVAIKSSFEVIRANVGPALLMTLLDILVNISGLVPYTSGVATLVTFGIFTLVTLPFASLFIAHMYRQFNHERIA